MKKICSLTFLLLALVLTGNHAKAQWNWPQLNDPVEILRVNDFSLCFGSTPTWDHRLKMSRQVGQDIEGYDGYVYRLNVTWEYMLHGQWSWKDDLPVNWNQPYDRHETSILVQCGWQNIYYRLRVQKERRYEGSYFWQPYDDPVYTWETVIGPDNTIDPGSLEEITMCPGQPVKIENVRAATGSLGALRYRFEVCYTGGKCDTEKWHQSHATSFETPAIATNTTNTGVDNFTPQYGKTIKWVRRIVYNDEGCSLYNPEMPGTGLKDIKRSLSHMPPPIHWKIHIYPPAA
jgi:hypothetical protein